MYNHCCYYTGSESYVKTISHSCLCLQRRSASHHCAGLWGHHLRRDDYPPRRGRLWENDCRRPRDWEHLQVGYPLFLLFPCALVGVTRLQLLLTTAIVVAVSLITLPYPLRRWYSDDIGVPARGKSGTGDGVHVLTGWAPPTVAELLAAPFLAVSVIVMTTNLLLPVVHLHQDFLPRSCSRLHFQAMVQTCNHAQLQICCPVSFPQPWILHCSPIYVCDAEPGDVLEVDILDLVPRKNPSTGKTYGSNAAAWWCVVPGICKHLQI